jgi:hypothetical protein
LNELIVRPEPPAAGDESTEQIPGEQTKSLFKPQSWHRYGVAACALALALAAGWAIEAKIYSHQLAQAQREAKTARRLAASNEAERNDVRVLREEVRALQAKLDTATRRRGAGEAGALEAMISSLDKKIEANRAVAGNAAEQLAATLEKHEKRIERMEVATSDKSPVSSTGNSDAKPIPKALSKPLAATTSDQNAKVADPKPPISGYALREVYDGLALVEAHGSLREVGPGDRLPRAGKVLAIKKIGRKWVVVTDEGRIEGQSFSPHSRYSPRRDPAEFEIDERF